MDIYDKFIEDLEYLHSKYLLHQSHVSVSLFHGQLDYFGNHLVLEAIKGVKIFGLTT